MIFGGEQSAYKSKNGVNKHKQIMILLVDFKVIGTILFFTGILPAQYFCWTTIFSIPYAVSCFFEPLSMVQGVSLLLAVFVEIVLWLISICLLNLKKTIHVIQTAILIMLNLVDAICFLTSFLQNYQYNNLLETYQISKAFGILYCIGISLVSIYIYKMSSFHDK